MAGNTTNGLPIIQPSTVNAVAISPPPLSHLSGTAERVALDTNLASGGVPQSVGASAWQIAQVAAGLIANRVTLSSNAATLNTTSGLVTSESLSTAAGLTQLVTLTNSAVATTSVIQIDAHLGTSTAGVPGIQSTTALSGSFVATIVNNGTAAFNGTLQIPFHL